MALKSRLFRGDPKLERAAIADSAHIVPGDRGPHVGKIQNALIKVDRAAIQPDLAFGPATAAAVRAFKQKRQILNFEGRIDDIVGIKTTAALDREMLAQESTFGCVLPSNARSQRQNLVGDAPKPPNPDEDNKIMQQAFRESRLTTRQATAAVRHLSFQIDSQRRGSCPAVLDAASERTFIIASKWLNLPTDPFAASPFIRTALGMMDRSLALRTPTGGELPLERIPATFIAGTSADLTGVPQPDNGLFFGTPFFDQHGPLCRRHAVTHELFHLVGAHHGGQPPHVKTDLSAVAQSSRRSIQLKTLPRWSPS